MYQNLASNKYINILILSWLSAINLLDWGFVKWSQENTNNKFTHLIVFAYLSMPMNFFYNFSIELKSILTVGILNLV